MRLSLSNESHLADKVELSPLSISMVESKDLIRNSNSAVELLRGIISN